MTSRVFQIATDKTIVIMCRMHIKERFEVITTSFNIYIFFTIYILSWILYGLFSNSEIAALVLQGGMSFELRELAPLLSLLLTPAGSFETKILFFVGLILFSFNATLLFAYAHRIRKSGIVSHVSASLFGSMLLAFGIQCLSCAAMLTFFATPVIVIAFLSQLPFEGKEIMIAGLLMLGVSSGMLLKKITDRFVC